jgi:hypothetical protein
MESPKLTIELVPKTAWYTNVRSNVPKAEWDRIRRKSYKKAQYRCEICNGVGPKHPVECHEIWEYDDDKKTQTLVGIISLCPKCHQVKHPGLAQMKGKILEVVEQLKEVNGITHDDAIEMLEEAFDVWAKRSQHEWELDISFLNTY